MGFATRKGYAGRRASRGRRHGPAESDPHADGEKPGARRTLGVMAVLGKAASAPLASAAPQATPETIDLSDVLEAEDRPWVTVVWDDPVNLMHYVTYIFQKLFGYSKAKATELMLQVHQEGKAVVSAGSRDKMEHDVQRLHAAGLWATMQRDDQ